MSTPRTALALAQQATLDTRTAKKPALAFGQQLAAWRRRAVELTDQRTVARLAETVGRQRSQPVEVELVDVHTLAVQVVARVETDGSTWTRWNVLAEVERACRGLHLATPADRDRIVEQVQGLATGPHLSVRIAAPQLVDEPTALRRSDGSSVYTPHAAERYTTTAILDAEQHLLAAAGQRTGHRVAAGLVDQATALVAHRAGHRLDAGQRALVAAFCCDDRRLVVGIGPAGSGKTTAMRAACAAWDAAGRRVIPLATSAKAAQVLAADLGRPADNLHKYLHDRSTGRGDAEPLRAGDVVVVDEAGMAGTRLLDRLVAHAEAAGAVVRLLGDPAQLSAVESGGALRLLAADAGAVELTALHRFADPDEAAATLQLRHGDPAALDFYQQRGRIRGGEADDMVEAAFTGWRADTLAGRVSVMGAADAATVTRLSARARLDRIARGAVQPAGARLHDDNRAGVGDWVVTRANDRLATVHRGRDFVKNGDLWAVTAHHRDGSLTVRHLDHGGRVHLLADYVATHVALAYATTAHRVQGGTVDTAHPIVTASMSREALYVLASRARQPTTLYVATDDSCSDGTDHAPAPPQTPRDILEQVLRHQAADKSATETLREVLADDTGRGQPGRLSALVAPYQHTLATAPPDAVRAHRQQLLDHGAWAPLPWITLCPGRPNTRDDIDNDATPCEPVVEAGQWVDALNTRAAAVKRRVQQLRADLAEQPGGASEADLLVACYREQCQIRATTDAPLGPVPPPRTARRQAYDSVVATQHRRPDAEPDPLPAPVPARTGQRHRHQPTGLQR